MQLTVQVYVFVCELFVLPLCKVSVSKWEKPLYLSLMRSGMNFVLELHSVPENPAYYCILNPRFLSPVEAWPFITRTLEIRLQPHFQAAGIDVEGIFKFLLTDLSLVCPYSCVFNLVVKLVQQMLEIATSKITYSVGFLKSALFALLNCTPFIWPLSFSSSAKNVLSGVVWFTVLMSVRNWTVDHTLLVNIII